jgi:hypothetical protein
VYAHDHQEGSQVAKTEPRKIEFVGRSPISNLTSLDAFGLSGSDSWRVVVVRLEHPTSAVARIRSNFFIRKFWYQKPQINKAKLPTGNPKDIHKPPKNCE